MSGPEAERAPTSSPGEWALSRALATACADEELAERCVAGALLAAGAPTVPADLEPLLAFVRSHLVPVLAEELGPRTGLTIVEDLEAEIVRVRSSTVRMARVALRRIATPATPLTLPPLVASAPISSNPSPTVRSPAPSESLPPTRPVVAIVDPDRWRRAATARGLLQAGCDVLPLDTPTELLELIAASHAASDTRIDALIIDLAEAGADEAIAATLRTLPETRVLARGTAVGAIVAVTRG